MNKKLLALIVIAILPLMAFDCITSFSDVTISLNLKPFNVTYPLNDGTKTTYSGSFTINPMSLYDSTYTLTGASVYDITVATKGPDLGNGAGTVTVNGVTLFSYNGAWTYFNTARSLLTTNPPTLTRNPAGITELINAVTGHRSVVFAVSGTIGTPPATKDVDFLIVSAYVQAYGHRN
jgi:hypothetical protein